MLAILITAAVAVLLVTLALILAGQWFARSWVVVEDDALHYPRKGISWLLRAQGWLVGPRRLTYRRDKRGRFREHRR